MNKFGEQNWSDVATSDEKTVKTDFMRLAAGSNPVRVMTLPHAYYQHTFAPKGGRKFGWRVNCSDPEHNQNCSLCAKGDKPIRKWFIGVINRKTNAYQILDIGYSIFKGLKNLASDEENWGPSMESYDINIINNPSAGAQRYSVIPTAKKPLSATDLQLKNDHPTDELMKKCAPPAREVSDNYIAHIIEELRASGVEVEDDEDSNEEASTTSSGSDDDFFKDYDKK